MLGFFYLIVNNMATGKKSFVLYADLLKSVDHLTNDELGRLFKHILEYVNDLHPSLEDRLLLTAWKPIERSLKEDLCKWERQLEQRRQAGLKSAESRQRKSTSVNGRQRASTDSVTVTVNDNVFTNVNVFLEWFNEQKGIHTGRKGNFKTLSTTDKSNLKQLSAYEKEDFIRAFGGMALNQWVKDNNAMNPSHFLRVDNFNRYLGSVAKELPKLDRIVAHTAVSSGGHLLQGYLDKGYTIEQLQNYAS
jgi:hypothetical protein